MSTRALLISLFKYKAWANEAFFEALKSMDVGQFAHERTTAIRVLNHVYVVDRIFVAHLQGQAHGYTANNTEATPTLDELLAAVRATDAWYLDYVGSIAPDDLTQNVEFTFTDGLAGRMSRQEILAHIAAHGANHRGAVGRIMDQTSVTRPKDIFTAYLHQAEPERRLRA